MAKAQAQWGKHKFLISSNQLNPMGDFSTSSEAKASDSKSNDHIRKRLTTSSRCSKASLIWPCSQKIS